jgi:hypothetical protein
MQIANYKANGELITSAGSGSGAPTDATYITQTANGSLSAEQALASLSTGLMKVTTTTGVVSSVTDSAGLAGCISDETGSGALVFGTAPTLGAPVIADYTSAQHDHGDADDGGLLPASSIGSGQVAVARGGTGADLSATGPGHLMQASSGANITVVKDNLSASVAPTVNEDSGDGYGVGSRWYDLVNLKEYVAFDVSVGAAVWIEIINQTAGSTIDAAKIASGTLPLTRGGTGQSAASNTALFNAIDPLTTKGDLIVHDGTNSIRLAVGTDTHVLTADSGEASGVKWAAATGGSGTTETGNFIKNASFENWENGTAAAPDAWVLTGASATVAREGTIIKHGLYSGKLTRAGTDCNLMQDIYVPGGSTFVRSRQYTFGAWVYATVASRVRLRMDDGVTVTNSSYHTGGSTWEWLTVTATLGAAITTFKVGLQVDTGDTSGYIDGMAITEAATLTAGFYPSIMPFNAFPQRAIMFHEDALVTAGNALAASHDAVQNYAHYFTQNTPADADTFTQSVWLRAGTYTFSVLGLTLNNAGLIDWYIDDVTFTTGQDWYSASLTYNVTKTVGSIAVIGDGYHVLKGKVNGKNASSSSYFMPLTRYWFRASAD